MNSKEKTNMSVKIVTGVVRLSYFNGWEPKATIDGGRPKYGTSILVPKSDTETIKKIKDAIDKAIKEGVSTKFGGKTPNLATLKTPLRDGDLERPDDPAYKNCYFLNASSNTAPQIVDHEVEPILDKSEVYSGCYAKVSLSFYPYSVNGNKGIAAGLGNIQLIKQGEPLGGKTNASQDFGSVTSDDFM